MNEGGWRILDLTRGRAAIAVERGAIVVTTDDVEESVPAAGVTFSSGVLHRLADHDVVMMMCDWRGIPRSVAQPWADGSRIASRQIAQTKVSRRLLGQLWQEIVRAKVLGQAATLASVKPRFAPKLAEMAGRISVEDIANVEGEAARYYWPRLLGKGFVRDHSGEDRVNALLNYGYGIVRGYGIQAVLSPGLISTLGIWHRHRANAFNLVSDLMEPFRPAVDYAVLHLPAYSSLRKAETMKMLASVLHLPFTPAGATLAAELRALAKRYGRLVEGKRERFEVPVWRGGAHWREGDERWR